QPPSVRLSRRPSDRWRRKNERSDELPARSSRRSDTTAAYRHTGLSGMVNVPAMFSSSHAGQKGCPRSGARQAAPSGVDFLVARQPLYPLPSVRMKNDTTPATKADLHAVGEELRGEIRVLTEQIVASE